jgi:alanine dehydrogenase
VPAAVPSGATAVRLRGRLEYGFAIADDGYASFLRLQDAKMVAGLAR